jgi:hypothetical protein
MRGTDHQQLFTYLSPGTMVSQDHPLLVNRRVLADAAPARLSTALSKTYSATGRPSIPSKERCGRCC